LGPTKPSTQWVLDALSSGVKWLGFEVDNSPPPGFEVKNVYGAISPLPQYTFMMLIKQGLHIHGMVLG